MKRPGYLAGYQPFGKTKGMVTQAPSPPPPEVLAPASMKVALPPAIIQPALPPTMPLVQPRPMMRPPADPVVLAKIAALQARVAVKTPQPRLASPRTRPPAEIEDDDED